MSIETWLATGKKAPLGPMDVYVMPLPLDKLREIAVVLQEKVHEELVTILKKQQEAPDAFMFIGEVLGKIDAVDIVYSLLSEPAYPDGKAVNKDLTRDHVKRYLDAPTIRGLFNVFVEVNELEELIKNLQSLPWASHLWEALTMTFGISLSNFLLPNMGLLPGKLESSLSHKSTGTSEPGISGTTQSENPTLENQDPVSRTLQ